MNLVPSLIHTGYFRYVNHGDLRTGLKPYRKFDPRTCISGTYIREMKALATFSRI